MPLFLIVVLIIIAFVGGICITTIGPGGIFVTIALFVLADLDPSTVAGTASATFIATGLVGSIAYFRSGELANRVAGRAAVLLSAASVVGGFAGSQLNTLLDARVFGALLGGFVLLTGALVLVRQLRGLEPVAQLDLSKGTSMVWMVVLGVVVGLHGGLLGVVGPVLAVPLLVLLGVPMLLALGLAQVQSIFISIFATFGYALHGAIDLTLAVLVGVPLLIGTVLGWWIARRVDPSKLKLFLSIILLLLGAYLLFGGGTPT